MDGLSEVRKKLERAIHAAYRHGYGKGGADENGNSWRPEASADEYLSNLPAIVSGALALLESEQGIQTEALVGISKYPCIGALLGEGTEEDDFCGCAACVAGYALRGNQILVRAILGTESEGT